MVLDNQGYPERPVTGDAIEGLNAATAHAAVQLFHAGTALDDGVLRATGGRVLCVTATGADLAQARDRAHRAVDLVTWPHRYLRRDIGWRLLGAKGAGEADRGAAERRG